MMARPLLLRTLILLTFLSIGFCLAQDLHAFRNLNFGDSMSSVVQQVNRDPVMYTNENNAVIADKPQVLNDIWFVNFGEDKYKMRFEFSGDKLFRVQFTGTALTAPNALSLSLNGDSSMLISTQLAKGKPSESHSVGIRQIDDGTVHWSRIWQGEDGVTTKYGIAVVDGEYREVMWLEWTWMVDFIGVESSSQWSEFSVF